MPSANQQLLTAIGNLSQTIQRLDDHMTNSEGAAMSRAPTPGTTTSGGVVIPGLGTTTTVSQGGVSAQQIAQAAQQELAQRARQDQIDSESGRSRSLPPSANKIPDSEERQAQRPTRNLGDEDPLETLTWQELGNVGGPLGRFRTRQWGNQQYARAGAGVLGGIGSSQRLGGTVTQDENGNNVYSDNLGGRLLRASNWMDPKTEGGIGNTAIIGLTGLQSAYLIGSGWSQTGRDLGYGDANDNRGWMGFLNPGSIFSRQGGQGFSLSLERQALMGRVPGMGFGSGMTAQNAEQTVNTLAGLGFSNQNGVNGDNFNIARNLIQPMVNQGVSVQGAADWTEALRNSNTSISQLMNSLGGLNLAARATKETTDQYNSSLLQLAQTQVSMGGTAAQAGETGAAFTRATGLAPGILGQIQQNPMYQGIMMAQNGVLPSGITDLTPGAQIQGVMSLMQLLGGAFGGLNKTRYETVGGIKVPTAYGSQLEASQIAEAMHIPQSVVMRIMKQMPFERQITGLEKVIGSSTAQGSNGESGSGIYSILNHADHWSGLNASQREQATRYWNAGIGSHFHGYQNDLGLSKKEVKHLYSTTNIRKRLDELNRDLTGNQQNNPNNQIKVEISMKGNAGKYFSAKANKKYVQIIANAGGPAPNNLYNTPTGDALIANDPGTGLPISPGQYLAGR